MTTPGLTVRFTSNKGACLLQLEKPHPGPTLAEREAWRLAFQVPLYTWAYKALDGEQVIVQYEWTEPVEPDLSRLPWIVGSGE